MNLGPRNPFRHQLASTSPIRLRGLARGAQVVLGGGDPRPELGELLRAEYGVAGVTLCGSGTEALLLALRTAERIRGEPQPVALPAYTCFDVAAAAVAFGRPIHFYDVDPLTLGPDLGSVAGVVQAGVGTLVAASLYGVPIDWTALGPLLPPDRVVVIEDAAQGHGARWQGVRLGGHGRLGVMSFARGKGWTGGAGGAVLARAPADLEALPSALPHISSGNLEVLARAGAQRWLGHPGIYGIPRSLPVLGLGETRFRPVREPVGLPASAAALLLDSFSAAEQEVAARRDLAEAYGTLLVTMGITPVTVPAGGEPGFVRYPLVMEGGLTAFGDPREAERLGIAPGYPIPLPMLAELASLKLGSGAWPGAEKLARDLVTLPTHGRISPRDREALLRRLASLSVARDRAVGSAG